MLNKEQCIKHLEYIRDKAHDYKYDSANTRRANFKRGEALVEIAEVLESILERLDQLEVKEHGR